MGILNRKTQLVLESKALNKVYLSKTNYANTIESEFSFLGWKLPRHR